VPAYVAFLRAINLGQNRKVPMADLRPALLDAGLTDVETHIHTGNVRFTSRLRSNAAVEVRVERVLRDRYGFAVPTIAMRPAELRQVHQDALAIPTPAFAVGRDVPERRYVNLFKAADAPDDDARAEIAGWRDPGEVAVAVGRAVHLWMAEPGGAGRFYLTFAKLLAPSTNRNLRVVATLADRWCR
jgi:uncharacterized protein (DUF1697 family)